VSLGDVVHVVGVFVTGPDDVATCVVNNQHNLFIVHPDHLVTGTLASDSLSCMRRSVLNERFKGAPESSTSLVFGSMVRAARLPLTEETSTVQ